MNDKREVRELVQAVIDAGALPADYPMIVNENVDQRIPGLSTLMHYRLVRALQKDLDSPALFGDIRKLSDQDIREFPQVGPKTMAHLKETLLDLLPSESPAEKVGDIVKHKMTPDEYIEWLEEIGRQVEEMTIPDFDELIERSSLGSPTSKHLQELGLAVIDRLNERNGNDRKDA